ncbi:VWA domain-containing protein [Psychrobium sp. 1_MG-2023]|uniref:vWA domain-containing protein n=1 Tax=Psychrobium sp. 1_MG-2023 TaxID=3062624 RepID=UPI0027377988|nr:VWA domain-containing protein [Psychrobium sp. 1_MG-2023]MDP2559959.1 VWA domain-containing protein [Psychrobium sp. 1_MG-2023]
MLVDFFFTLRKHELSVSVRELLDLLNALERQVVFADIDKFYQLARIVMIKDESQFDKFDRAFSEYFKGINELELFSKDIPQDWLRKELEKILSDEEKEQLNALGSLDELLDTLQQRLKEQKKRHQGGNKWVGTGGTSPFGAYGYNPQGVRIGQESNRNNRAAKVWDKREFANLSEQQLLSARNVQVALRRLRKFARSGAQDILDLDHTIKATANNAGYLDLKMVAERHNAVKVLMFFDVGGSMDPYIEQVEQLFNAARGEFKHLEYFYFHNCVYEGVWQDNARRHHDKKLVWDILRTYGKDYKVIFVGDASMGPYEISYPGGSVEHWNEESGEVWLTRLISHFDHVVWLNPIEQQHWRYTMSIDYIKQLVNQNMHEMTVAGLEQAIKSLK